MQESFEPDPNDLVNPIDRNRRLIDLLQTIWIDVPIDSVRRGEKDSKPGWWIQWNS